MRFLHKDFEPIRRHLEAGPAEIHRLEWDLNPVVRDSFSILSLKPKRRRAAPPRPASLEDVAALFTRSARIDLASGILGEYFHVNRPPSDRAVSLAAAIEHVEAFGAPDEVLLAAHPEGGLVSVSRRRLPFQEAAPEAPGWAPDTRWDP